MEKNAIGRRDIEPESLQVFIHGGLGSTIYKRNLIIKL